jgi:YD repeat-containing protein
MRRNIIGALVCMFVIGFGVCGHAQVDPCQHWATGILQPFPAGFGPWNCYLIEFVGYTCGWYSCPPPNAVGRQCNCIGGAPIDLLTGNTFIKETDVRIPGLSDGLRLIRTWNSQWPPTVPAQGLFGMNWRSTYEERLWAGTDGYIWYIRGDGSLWAFAGFLPHYLVAPENLVVTLTTDSNYTYWTMTFQNGEKRIFDYLSGWLTAIIDRNGNTTQLSYDAGNRLVASTDPGGRHLYFNYPNNSSYLVSSVTSDVGITVSYLYDSQNRLTQATENDGSFLTFTYDASSNIIAVKDSLGNLIESHTYDSENRGLTSSRGSAGAEAITISYPNP